MKITLHHPSVKFGLPVFLDFDGKVMDQKQGIILFREITGFNSSQISHLTGYSRRTVEGWFTGQSIPARALNVLFLHLYHRVPFS